MTSLIIYRAGERTELTRHKSRTEASGGPDTEGPDQKGPQRAVVWWNSRLKVTQTSFRWQPQRFACVTWFIFRGGMDWGEFCPLLKNIQRPGFCIWKGTQIVRKFFIFQNQNLPFNDWYPAKVLPSGKILSFHCAHDFPSATWMEWLRH